MLGQLVVCLISRFACLFVCLVGRLFDWICGRVVRMASLVGGWFGWLVGRLFGWIVWLVVCCSVDQFAKPEFRLSRRQVAFLGLVPERAPVERTRYSDNKTQNGRTIQGCHSLVLQFNNRLHRAVIVIQIDRADLRQDKRQQSRTVLSQRMRMASNTGTKLVNWTSPSRILLTALFVRNTRAGSITEHEQTRQHAT